MIMLVHIAIALSSMLLATYALLYPSVQKLRLTYALIAATVASGVYLVLANPARLAHVCITGLIYLGLVTITLAATRHGLASRAG